MTTMMVILVRVRDQVYDTRELALADGWDDAEYGYWIPSDCDISRGRNGWIALSSDPDDAR
jgi:hypothetical protein